MVDSGVGVAGGGEPDPRIYFAAERTLLSWVRTGLAMMGFGFVVSRFGLFLHHLALLRDGQAPPPQGPSLAVGVTLVVGGVLLTVAAAVRYVLTIRRLRSGRPLVFRPISLGVVVAVALALLGALLVGLLVVGIEPSAMPPVSDG